MRIILFLIVCIIVSCSPKSNTVQGTVEDNLISSEIDRTSYYNMYKVITTHRVTTNFIRSTEAIPYIKSILKEHGLNPETEVIYDLPNGEQIVLDLYDDELNLGVLFKTGHFGSVKEEHREININIDSSYANQSSLTLGGLFDNIIVLQETWYWYQYTEEDLNVELLNKSDILKIMKEDVLFHMNQYEEK